MISLIRKWTRIVREARAEEYRLAVESAHALFDSGEYEKAAQAYDGLIRRPAEVAKHAVNRGYCEWMLNQLDRAQASFTLARETDPTLANAWVGLGDVAAKLVRHDEAVVLYTKAIELQPGLATAHNNRGQSLVALGRLREAWADAEYRFDISGGKSSYPHQLALPVWDGKSPGRVLVHWEQGFVDILQYLRFLPMGAQRGWDLHFECPPPLLSLVRRMQHAPECFAANEYPPSLVGMEFRLGLSSLPHLLGCDEQSLDARPYLAADLSKSHHFREQLGISDKPCIGIVWRAGALDTSRSVPLEWLLNCAARLSPAVQLVSLQREVEASEKTLLQQYGCIEAGTRFLDFDDTAAAIAALDATITVDTAVAHLAGALGFPTYLLLNEPADVRWMVDRKDTPWYSRMHLLRKNAQEHWQPMLTQALKLAAKSRSDHSQAGLRPTITY